MKKMIKLAVAALAVAGTFSLSSCSKSNQEVLEEFQNLMKESEEARRNGDIEKSIELMQKANEYGQKHAEQIQAATLEQMQENN